MLGKKDIGNFYDIHMIRAELNSLNEIDDEVKHWLKVAYALDAS